MKKYIDYADWEDVCKKDSSKMSKEEKAKHLTDKKIRQKQSEEHNKKENTIINSLVERFNDLFKQEVYLDKMPSDKRYKYTYKYAPDWSDFPHLTIWYHLAPGGWDGWNFFRRGTNNGEEYDSPVSAFRGYLEDPNYGIGDLTRFGDLPFGLS